MWSQSLAEAVEIRRVWCPVGRACELGCVGTTAGTAAALEGSGLPYFAFYSEFKRIGHVNEGQEGVSSSGDVQDPPGQGPVQPALGDPASAGG